jgi:hypothetical protein
MLIYTIDIFNTSSNNPLWRNWLARLTVTPVAIRRLEVRAFPEEDYLFARPVYINRIHVTVVARSPVCLVE